MGVKNSVFWEVVVKVWGGMGGMRCVINSVFSWWRWEVGGVVCAVISSVFGCAGGGLAGPKLQGNKLPWSLAALALHVGGGWSYGV